MHKQQSIKLQELHEGHKPINLKGSYLDINPIDILPSDIAKEDTNVYGLTFIKVGKDRKFIVGGERQHG